MLATISYSRLLFYIAFLQSRRHISHEFLHQTVDLVGHAWLRYLKNDSWVLYPRNDKSSDLFG